MVGIVSDKVTDASWAEFVLAVQTRFQRNQHTVLLSKLYHISQTGTVEDYVQMFSDLVDQISAYEIHPDPLHYLTRFLDGLTPAVRVLVAIQQPVDLDNAYTMALLYEELEEGNNPWSAQFVTPPPPRRWHSSSPSTSVSPAPPLPAPPTRWVSKSVEEKRVMKLAIHLMTSGRSSRLTEEQKECYVCGEKWGRERQCKTSIQLHVV